ncbi:MAG TPA: CopG family antitoxin [Candidatus Dormibacteraeota bacterium]|nr:CopG family antitoxin [Candidatus Dormibacteraeota bacterium]
MKYFDPQDLDKEEKEELEAIENGEYVEVKDMKKEIEEAKLAAKATLNKTRNINIRLSEQDLYRIKAKAVEEGMPYQSLVSSIVHKAVATK